MQSAGTGGDYGYMDVDDGGYCRPSVDAAIRQDRHHYEDLQHKPELSRTARPELNHRGRRQQPPRVELVGVPPATMSTSCCRRPPCWGWVVLITVFIIAATQAAILVILMTSAGHQDITATSTGNINDQGQQCGPLYMVYVLDDRGEVYADGVLIDTNEFNKIGIISIPLGTQLLAFRTLNIDDSSPCGVRASISSGIITDWRSSWKCSDEYTRGWNETGFDDSSWSETQVQSRAISPHVCTGCHTIGCGQEPAAGQGPYYFRISLTS